MLALREGAANYIPKRLLPRKLAETVGRVMAVSRRRRSHVQLNGFMTEHRCTFRLANAESLLESLVLYLQENALAVGLCDEVQCTQIGIALYEALLNALYHGNLELGPSYLADSEEAFASLVAHRSSAPPYQDRRIHLAATLEPDKGIFVVRDEGRGFDPSALPDPSDASALEKATGRGLILMRLFMDEVSFDSTGREVTLTKWRKAHVGVLSRHTA